MTSQTISESDLFESSSRTQNLTYKEQINSRTCMNRGLNKQKLFSTGHFKLIMR